VAFAEARLRSNTITMKTTEFSNQTVLVIVNRIRFLPISEKIAHTSYQLQNQNRLDKHQACALKTARRIAHWRTNESWCGNERKAAR
jgi:hypothetical protein